MKNKKLRAIIRLFFIALTATGIARGQDTTGVFSRPAFYITMANGNLDAINIQLTILRSASVTEKGAFEGALMMKKAGLISSPKNKLSLFKSGRNKLEGMLSKDSTNAEFRFLRLMIQENAPRILEYKSELAKDGQYIRIMFKGLSSEVQQAIIEYSKKSNVLHATDF